MQNNYYTYSTVMHWHFSNIRLYGIRYCSYHNNVHGNTWMELWTHGAVPSIVNKTNEVYNLER